MGAHSSHERAQVDRMNRLFLAGDFAAVAELGEQLVAGGLQWLEPRLRWAEACLKLGRYRDAADVLTGASSLEPATPAELMVLAKHLMRFTESEALVSLARRSLAAAPWSAAAEADLAALVSMVGVQDVAGPLLDRAMASVSPVPPAWLYNRSQVRMYSGRFSEAEQDLRSCLRLNPRDGKAWWALSKLPGLQDLAGRVGDLAKAGTASAEGDNEAYRQFALFNCLDRLGRCDEAWDALQAGCRIKRRLVKYEAESVRAQFRALASMPPLPSVGAPEARRASAAEPGPVPIFVVGMHRSGTTLLERLLGGHSQVREAGELYDFPAQLRWAANRHFAGPSDALLAQQWPSLDLPQVGRRYLDHVRWRADGASCLVDKLPSNFINIGFIRRALPQARILHMRRNPMDTCFSNLKELFSNACAYSYDQLELADYYLGYRDLMRHWQQACPGFVLDVDYEALAGDPEGQMRRILAFCGLPWDAGCLAPAAAGRAFNTASSAQIREPVHRRNIDAWRRYEAHLDPLRTRLSQSGLLDLAAR